LAGYFSIVLRGAVAVLGRFAGFGPSMKVSCRFAPAGPLGMLTVSPGIILCFIPLSPPCDVSLRSFTSSAVRWR
jgi:hypothetical protein